MRKFAVLLLFLLFVSIAHPEFTIKSVDVTINMDEDGSANVQEVVKFYVGGQEAQANYVSGLSNNELSFWSSTTELPDLRAHLNSEVVNVQNFRIIPQPMKNCNPVTNICLGEISMNYDALPYYNINSGEIIENTGLFSADNYKPRTTKFLVNPDALFFETAEVEHIIRLNSYTTLTINLPEGSKVLEVSPVPDDLEDISFPNDLNSYTWKNTLLVKFSFIYETEQGLDEEVLNFFSDLYGNLDSLVFGPEGLSIIVILLILFAFYVALTSINRKKGN